VVWVLWGSTYFAIRVGVETLPPLLMAGVRYVVAGLLMFPFAIRSGGPELRAADRPRAAGWWSALLVGALLLAGGNGGVSAGERSVPSGLAALLVATVPLWLIIIDRVVNGARIGMLALAGLVAGVVGVGFLAGPFGGGGHASHAAAGHGGAGGSPGIGIVIILVASVSWASGTIASRRVPLPSRPLLATSMQMLAGGAVLLVAAAVTGEFGQFDPAHVSAASWLALAYLIGPGSIIAFSAYVVAVRRLPTATVATYAYVNPIIAVILGTSLLGEALTASMLVGGALIVVAVVLVVRSQAAARR
jgi:drug/metabolite transporter (DMT)-like permease